MLLSMREKKEDQYNQLLDAVKKNDDKRISSILKSNPELLDYRDKSGKNLIHHVMEFGNNIKALEVIFQHLQISKKTLLLIESNSEGNTPVHIAARHNSSTMLTALISIIEPDKLFEVCRRKNKEEMNAVDLAHLNEKNKDTSMAKILMQVSSYPAFEPVYIKEVLSTYPDSKENHILIENLTIACEVANRARALFNESNTHERVEVLSPDEQKEITLRVRKARAEFNKLTSTDEYEQMSEEEQNVHELKYHYEVAKIYGAGNCDEFSYVGYKILRDLYPDKVGEIINLSASGGGSHVFLIIDRDRSQDDDKDQKSTGLLDINSLGKNAVVCDVHSGEVYPAKDISQRLKYHQFDEFSAESKNTYPSFNPKKHRLRVGFFMKPEVRKEQETNKDKLVSDIKIDRRPS